MGRDSRRRDPCTDPPWVQQETLGHCGRAGAPLYQGRRLLLARERLDATGLARLEAKLAAGDPYDEVACASMAN